MEQRTPHRSLTLEEGIILALQQAWEFATFQDGFGLDQTINLNLPVLAFGLIIDGEVITTWCCISNLIQGGLKFTLFAKTAVCIIRNVTFLLTLLSLQA